MNQLIMYWNLKLTLWFQYFLTILWSKEFDHAYHGIIRFVRSDPDIIVGTGKKRFLLSGESFPINQFVGSTFQLKNGLVTYVFEFKIRALLLVVSCVVSHVIIHFHFVIDACLFNLICSWNVNCWCLFFFFFFFFFFVLLNFYRFKRPCFTPYLDIFYLYRPTLKLTSCKMHY